MASKTTDPIDILLEVGIDLDNLSEEEDYLSALMEAANTLTIKDASDPRIAPLQQEILKLRKKRFNKARPEAKKTKISADSFRTTKKIEPKVTRISSQKLLPGSGGALVPAPVGQEKEGEKKESVIKILSDISDSVKRIVDILVEGRKLDRKLSDEERKNKEAEARGAAENKLEKAFKTLKNIATGMLKPVAKPINALLNFIKNLILGKIVLGIFDWFSDPKNQEKVESITRFLGDHWPKLLALYLVFGNAFGRFVFRLTKTLVSGAIKLGIAIAKLLAAKKVKGAAGVARFLGGGKGRLLATGLTTAITLGGAYAMTQGMKGDDKTQKFSGGGYVTPRIPAFSGGGLLSNLFGGMGKGAAMGAMFGPLGALLGAGLGSGKIQEGFGVAKDMIGGFVSGEKGVDKVPAMLSDGEFVMSRGAVKKYGVGTLESMNAAGGGTNRPKMVDGTTYAAGGGLIQEKIRKASVRRPGDSEDSDAKFVLKDDQKYENKSGGFAINPSVNVSNEITRTGTTKEWMRMSRGAQARAIQEYRSRKLKNTQSRIRYLLDLNKRGVDEQGRPIRMINSPSVTIRDLSNVMINSPQFSGAIRENTGVKIPGATDDRRLIPMNPVMMNMMNMGIAAQPGEYMLPSKTVTALGGPNVIDRVVARTDSNSKAAKLGGSNVDINISPPSTEGRIKVIPLPPREEPDTSMVGGLDGSEVPNFSAGTGSRAKQKTLGVVR